jgi:pantoate--beta-alanine ligase
LKIIEHFIKNNYSKIKVISCKTIREKNGIAYSSRNKLLSKEDKKIASKVYQILLTNKKNLLQKKISLKNIQSKIYALGIKKIDYIEILNINKLIRPYKRGRKHRIFLAYYLKKVRLIDNI